MLGQPDTLNKIYIKSPLTGQQVPLSAFMKFDTGHTSYLSINHQGQFPAVTLSFNLAAGRRARRCGDRHPESGCRRSACRDSISGTFQGTAQAFQDSLKTAAAI